MEERITPSLKLPFDLGTVRSFTSYAYRAGAEPIHRVPYFSTYKLVPGINIPPVVSGSLNVSALPIALFHCLDVVELSFTPCLSSLREFHSVTSVFAGSQPQFCCVVSWQKFFELTIMKTVKIYSMLSWNCKKRLS
ncbi:hypothetical protein CDAR_618351 [Caerostris darwini]|uniref:Uncharacterized protein n=1 Tax=Caerostris darwini TaxID=1538125 RepID=A0AAV4SUF1_9ARAC|nr:hypothetical protein CDAR_618351 [Caerostris darwini]